MAAMITVGVPLLEIIFINTHSKGPINVRADVCFIPNEINLLDSNLHIDAFLKKGSKLGYEYIPINTRINNGKLSNIEVTLPYAGAPFFIKFVTTNEVWITSDDKIHAILLTAHKQRSN